MDEAATITKPTSLREVLRRRLKLRNPHEKVCDEMSKLDKIAIWITQRIGTFGFFLIILIWTIFWLGWNLLAPVDLRFDPGMGFVLWLFISNMIQILLMPLLMVGQNLQGRQADARAEHDLEVNIKAEGEIEVILQHLEYQNNILIAMLGKLGISVDEAIKKIEK